MAGVLLTSVVIAVGSNYLFPKFGTCRQPDQVPLDWSCPLISLPVHAAEVSYHYGGLKNPHTFYEFRISPKQFEVWIQSMPRFKPAPNEFCRYDPELGPFTWINVTDDGPKGKCYKWIDPLNDVRRERIGYDGTYCYYHFAKF